MGHVLGAEKGIFQIRGDDGAMLQGGRAGLILSIPAKEVSLGSPRVGTIHVQAPTPHTPPLQAFLVDFSQQTTRFSHLFPPSERGPSAPVPSNMYENWAGVDMMDYLDGRRRLQTLV